MTSRDTGIRRYRDSNVPKRDQDGSIVSPTSIAANRVLRTGDFRCNYCLFLGVSIRVLSQLYARDNEGTTERIFGH